jgi:hypothetical protein
MIDGLVHRVLIGNAGAAWILVRYDSCVWCDRVGNGLMQVSFGPAVFLWTGYRCQGADRRL